MENNQNDVPNDVPNDAQNEVDNTTKNSLVVENNDAKQDTETEPAKQPDDFKAIQTKVKQKTTQKTTPQDTPKEDLIKSFINSFQKEYETDETLKNQVAKEIQAIKLFDNEKNKEEVLFGLLEKSVEKIEQTKKRQLEIQKENEDIQKITGYTAIIKKIELMKKDIKYKELYDVLNERSPKLAYEIFANLTNSFFNIIPNTNIANSQNMNVANVPQGIAGTSNSCLPESKSMF